MAKRPRASQQSGTKSIAFGHAGRVRNSHTDQVHRIFSHSTYAHFPISRFPTPDSRLPKTQNESNSPN
ncbi:MAG: hypothetical protein F6K50_14955 [Moorea sp. SIO3I7]|uniref:hypothetical protein n=1 Tax=Moorena sp. SIO3I8 TaxID=2607833 RepID=UPI0013C0BAB5|nr:hypothetical protein [Moorena sp. SIO3I8]NEN96782.1 hypothetical protein [Moorena sp. SIO3I7]NEO05333.1 hypothetical protein [Moorena sp. SIO3I8]